MSILLTAVSAPSLAEVIDRIQVTGNQRVEPATVFSYLSFQEGEEFDPRVVSETVKTLYATGLFHHVDVAWDGGIITIEVAENPLVNKVAFEGNKEIVDDRLKEIVTLRPRAIFTQAKVQRDVQELLAGYRSRGRFLTQVRPQLIERDQNRVDVIYVIDEGDKTKISTIRFIGNKRFSDGDLKEVVATREKAWWRLLGGGTDSYDPNRLEVDKQLLRQYYLQHGYADFQVTSAVAELARAKDEFFVTYTLAEGPKYDFGQINVALEAEADGLDLDAMRQEVKLETGELYDASRVDSTIDTLVDHLGVRGFAFLEVQPDFTRHEAEREVDVTFKVTPGPRVYVNRINIEGNDRTRDYVIRRELRLDEGDAFSSRKLQRSRDRLNRMGYFKDVTITQAETDVPDRLDMTVKVEEQSTGEFNVGAGASSFEGALLTADVKERNFMGKGQEVAVRFALSEVRQDFNVSFTEPYFLGHELAAGVDAFNEQTDFQDESSFDLDNTGAAVRFRFPLGEFTSNLVRVGFKETKISNVGGAASQFVQREEGKRSSLFVGNTVGIDTRDNRLIPTRGYRASVGVDASGFGSDVDYLRSTVSGAWYKEVYDDIVFSIGGNAGAISAFGEDLPIYEHFSGGGTHLIRGFDRSGIGPRDAATNDALGGQFQIGHNMELTFPLPGADDLGIHGLLFSDGGIVTEFEGATDAVTDSQIYRVTAGGGIFWRSPVGPIRLEFGVPLVKASEDQTQLFSFNLGTRF